MLLFSSFPPSLRKRGSLDHLEILKCVPSVWGTNFLEEDKMTQGSRIEITVHFMILSGQKERANWGMFNSIPRDLLFMGKRISRVMSLRGRNSGNPEFER